jgi:hypothetical protein
VSINWLAFVTVVVAALVTAAALMTLFSAGLRLNDGKERWRRPLAVLMFVLCGVLVLGGIWLVVPVLHPGL